MKDIRKQNLEETHVKGDHFPIYACSSSIIINMNPFHSQKYLIGIVNHSTNNVFTNVYEISILTSIALFKPPSTLTLDYCDTPIGLPDSCHHCSSNS